MSNVDPPSTASVDSGATMGPTGTFTDADSEFEFERDPFSGAVDGDGDGEPDLGEQRFDSWSDVEDLREGQAQVQAEERAEAAAAAAAEEAEQAAREAAAEAGEPYYLGSGTHDGEPVEMYLMPDGATYMVDADGQVVAVAFPEDPVYMGQVYTDDGALDVYELYDGSQVVVDDGELVGTLDEVDHATVPVDAVTAPLMGIPPDVEVDEVYTVPMGPPTYDTYVVDADTGEVVGELDTGNELSNALPVDGAEGIATYDPPGADYTMHIDDGEVVNIVPNPEEPEWSFLGIVEYYEDGTVSVDLAIVEVDVDLIGPEKGVSVGVDLFFVEVSAGVDWDSDGNWSFEGEAGLDLGALEFGGGLDVSWEDGEFALGVDGYVEMQMGIVTLNGEFETDITVSDDGLVIATSAVGTATVLGAYVGGEWESSVAVGPNGLEVSAEVGVIYGHEWIGDFGVHAGGTFYTDGTSEGTGAGAELGMSMESPDEVWWAPNAVGGITSESGVRFSTDAASESYAESTGPEQDEGQTLDMGWQDDVGVGEEIDTPDDDTETSPDASGDEDSPMPGDIDRAATAAGMRTTGRVAEADDVRPDLDPLAAGTRADGTIRDPERSDEVDPAVDVEADADVEAGVAGGPTPLRSIDGTRTIHDAFDDPVDAAPVVPEGGAGGSGAEPMTVPDTDPSGGTDTVFEPNDANIRPGEQNTVFEPNDANILDDPITTATRESPPDPEPAPDVPDAQIQAPLRDTETLIAHDEITQQPEAPPTVDEPPRPTAPRVEQNEPQAPREEPAAESAPVESPVEPAAQQAAPEPAPVQPVLDATPIIDVAPEPAPVEAPAPVEPDLPEPEPHPLDDGI